MRGMRWAWVLVSVAWGRRRFVEIRKTREREKLLQSLRQCNVTDLSSGLAGRWQAAPDRRSSQFGLDAKKNEHLEASGASAAYGRLPHDYVPDDCRLRRFDARDYVARCRDQLRLAFVGDSLAEQVYKALVGMLAHNGMVGDRRPCDGRRRLARMRVRRRERPEGDPKLRFAAEVGGRPPLRATRAASLEKPPPPRAVAPPPPPGGGDDGSCLVDTFSLTPEHRVGFGGSTWATQVFVRFKVSRFDEAALDALDAKRRAGKGGFNVTST